MAEIIDDIAYLTQEIGPHPAGTEEEQRAALYVADQMQKEAGFATVVEDFQCVTNDQLPNIICFGVALLGAVLSIVVPSLGILWLLLRLLQRFFTASRLRENLYFLVCSGQVQVRT